MNTAVNFAKEALKGKPILESLKSNADIAMDNLKSKADTAIDNIKLKAEKAISGLSGKF